MIAETSETEKEEKQTEQKSEQPGSVSQLQSATGT